MQVGGSNLLLIHGNSLFKVLSTLYSEYEWLPWKFQNSPRHAWENIETQKKFVEWAGKELKIKNKNDWYNVTNKVTKMCVFWPY